MKISAKTLAAARRAAKARGMTLDSWAEEALTSAAAARRQPLDIEARLRKISKKLDQIAERQGLSERTSERLTDAVQEMGAAYNRARESAGRVLSQGQTRASSVADEWTAKARELLESARRSASDFVGPIGLPTDGEGDSAGEPPRRKRARKSTQSRTKAAGTTPRRSTASRKRSAKRSDSRRRRPRSNSNG